MQVIQVHSLIRDLIGQYRNTRDPFLHILQDLSILFKPTGSFLVPCLKRGLTHSSNLATQGLLGFFDYAEWKNGLLGSIGEDQETGKTVLRQELDFF